MAIDYKTRLQRLAERRFDSELNRSMVTESFNSDVIPENIRYLLEAMMKLDEVYVQRTYSAAGRVKNQLESGFKLHFDRDYDFQGSATTATNIRIHSDIDLLTVVGKYHYCAPDVMPEYPYKGDPIADIIEMRKQAELILSLLDPELDCEGSKSISVHIQNRKVDIVPCFWYNTKKYQETGDKFYRGVYFFNFKKGIRELDFPFSHIFYVNQKGNQTLDGSRKAIRLLKTLKADADIEIELSSFHLTTIVHAMGNDLLRQLNGGELQIAKNVSEHLEKLIINSAYRSGVQSPNGHEYPLKDDLVAAMRLLKTDLDVLIQDVEREAYYLKFANRELIYS